jgi:MoaA/NifB/PqqE/SkfB family radical SAM enzyme
MDIMDPDPPMDGEEYWAEVGPDKRLALPEEIAKRLGMTAGSRLRVRVRRDRIELSPDIHRLSRLYVEPTSRCNLACRTCIRSTWQEPQGDMDMGLFGSLASHLAGIDSLRSVMFGGFGEPTAHPGILSMIGSVKELGLRAEMVTNGTLLDEPLIRGLLERRLDALWVSFDGVGKDCFEDIRAGASFKAIVSNLQRLHESSVGSQHRIEIGIAFVATKLNVEALPKINELAARIHARKISVSNVLPYSKEMAQLTLNEAVLNANMFRRMPNAIEVSLPMMDLTNSTKEAIFNLARLHRRISIMTNEVSAEPCTCRFVREGCAIVRWDGEVSPCMGLLHSHTTFLDRGRIERRISSHTFGNIKTRALNDAWDSAEYRAFRQKVDRFDFSPCIGCECELLETNHEDCLGNVFPVCGGCLWAQGIIQCP